MPTPDYLKVGKYAYPNQRTHSEAEPAAEVSVCCQYLTEAVLEN